MLRNGGFHAANIVAGALVSVSASGGAGHPAAPGINRIQSNITIGSAI